MPRPVKWSRDLHSIRDRASRSKTETWSRKDIEDLFGVGRASSQSLMKAIGDVQAVGGTHFVDRSSLLSFLDEMAETPSVESALRKRNEQAAPTPRSKPLRLSLPAELRRAVLADLPANVQVQEGEIRITGPDAEQIVEGLLLLAQVMQNDLDSVRVRLDPPSPPAVVDEELRAFLQVLRT